MSSAIWVALLVGLLVGYYFGRWRAENRRARYDQDRIWRSRRDYRDYD